MGKPFNDPGLEKALLGLWIAADGLAEFLEDHEMRSDDGFCDCIWCEDAQGLRTLARIAAATVEASMDGPLSEKLRQVERLCFPAAGVLATWILGERGGDDADDGPRAA
jgi:hypothetical protein